MSKRPRRHHSHTFPLITNSGILLYMITSFDSHQWHIFKSISLLDIFSFVVRLLSSFPLAALPRSFFISSHPLCYKVTMLTTMVYIEGIWVDNKQQHIYWGIKKHFFHAVVACVYRCVVVINNRFTISHISIYHRCFIHIQMLQCESPSSDTSTIKTKKKK